MGKAVIVAFLCVLVSAAAVAQLQPLNVRTGSWEMTEVSSAVVSVPTEMQAMLSRLPPAQQEALTERFGGAPHTTTYKTCVTQADLDTSPFERPDQKCTWTTHTSTGTDMNLRGTCQSTNGGESADINMQIHVLDSQNATGTVQVSAAGAKIGTMNSNATFSGKWVSATCEK